MKGFKTMPIEVISKLVPKNDAFTGIVEADDVIGGVEGGTIPDNAVSSSSVTQHEADIDIDNLKTSETDTAKVFAPDGTGGVTVATVSGGGVHALGGASHTADTVI